MNSYLSKRDKNSANVVPLLTFRALVNLFTINDGYTVGFGERDSALEDSVENLSPLNNTE